MNKAPMPTHLEIITLLKSVLSGETSRRAAAEWAAEMQDNAESMEPVVVDPGIWHLLRLCASLDVESNGQYLHSAQDIEDWVSGKI